MIDNHPVVRALARQRWISKGVRRRLVDRVYPSSAEYFDERAFGCWYRGRFDSYIDRELYFFGAYEPGVLSVLARLARQRDRPVLLDVGANVGHHSLFAASHYAEVHAFEPYPPLVALLREKLERNGLHHVHAHAIGLGDVDGVAEYAAPADDRAGYGGFDNHDPNLRRFTLPIRRGDAYLAGLPVDKVDVVKVDVEGSEYRVLKGLGATLEAHRPALLLEYWPDSWPSSLEQLLPHDYRVWWLRERGTRWLIFNRESPILSPFALAPSGSMVLGLPAEWPVPDGLEIGER